MAGVLPDRAHGLPTDRAHDLLRPGARSAATERTICCDRAHGVRTDPGLALVLDPARLSAVVGEPVRATRVRPKAGVTHLAALVSTGADPEHPGSGPDDAGAAAAGDLRGWVRTLQGDARAKADKMRAQAARSGATLGELEVPEDDLLVLWGPAGSDPRLCRELERLRRAVGTDRVERAEVLRYNPGRRLVLRDGDVVHRVTEDEQRDRLTAVASALRSAGLPVVAPLPVQPVRSRHVTTWPWVPGHDASARPDRTVVRDVGALLHDLHAVPPRTVPGLAERRWPDVRQAAEASLRQLREVLALTASTARTGVRAHGEQLGQLVDRAGGLLTATEPEPGTGDLVVSHGDFSLDQVLVDDDGGMQLTDFDRAVLAPRELDLATLHAADIVDGVGGTAEVLDGYGPGRPTQEVLAPWVAAAILARVVQPWRMQHEGWVVETARILGAAIDFLEAASLAPATVVVPDRVRDGADEIVVARAWPGRAAEPGDTRIVNVAVEGRDGQGRLRAGTWSSDGRTSLLPYARDKKLPALAELVSAGELVVHRPGRRAVVRLEGEYAKVLRRGRAEGVAAAGRTGHELARRAGLTAPAVLAVDGDVIRLETVPGRPLHDLSGEPGWEAAWTTWAGAWTRLQALPHTDLELSAHTWADEAAGLRDWVSRAGPLLAGNGWVERILGVADELDAAHRAGPRLVPTHRDLHDKQLLWDGRSLAVLDLDTACLAPAALDPANLAVHADLRAAQGVWTDAEAAVVRDRSREVAERSGVGDEEWELARRATVARLVAVYAFRPRWRETVQRWAADRV